MMPSISDTFRTKTHPAALRLPHECSWMPRRGCASTVRTSSDLSMRGKKSLSPAYPRSTSLPLYPSHPLRCGLNTMF